MKKQTIRAMRDKKEWILSREGKKKEKRERETIPMRRSKTVPGKAAGWAPPQSGKRKRTPRQRTGIFLPLLARSNCNLDCSFMRRRIDESAVGLQEIHKGIVSTVFGGDLWIHRDMSCRA